MAVLSLYSQNTRYSKSLIILPHPLTDLKRVFFHLHLVASDLVHLYWYPIKMALAVVRHESLNLGVLPGLSKPPLSLFEKTLVPRLLLPVVIRRKKEPLSNSQIVNYRNHWQTFYDKINSITAYFQTFRKSCFLYIHRKMIHSRSKLHPLTNTTRYVLLIKSPTPKCPQK